MTPQKEFRVTRPCPLDTHGRKCRLSQLTLGQCQKEGHKGLRDKKPDITSNL